MATPVAVATKSKSWKAAVYVVAFLLLVGAAAWVWDGWLLVRLRVIASDTFTNGDPQQPRLFADGNDELKAYPPLRLVKQLSFSSPQIRSVVCLSLAERHDDRDPALWVGVIPKLIAVYTADSEAVVRECAKTALTALPCIPAEDVDAIMAFLGDVKLRDHSKGLRNSLLTKVHKSHPERLPEIIALSLEWLKAANAEERKSAFYLLVELAPTAPETLAVYRTMMDAGDPDRVGSGGRGEIMLRHHPKLIDEFLAGNTTHQKMIFAIALQETQTRYHDDAAIRYKQSTPPPRKHLLTERHLEQVQGQSVERVTPKTPLDDAQKVFEFLRYRPNGAALLMNYARRLNGKHRAAAIYHAYNQLLNGTEAASYVPELIPWLWENDRDVQHAVLRYISSGYDDNWLKPQKTGPDSPIVVAWRRWFDENPDRDDYRQRGVAILLQYARTIREDDVDRAAGVVCRELAELEKVEARKAPSWCNEADLMFKWLDENPKGQARPSVKRFLDLHSSLEAKKIVMRFPRR